MTGRRSAAVATVLIGALAGAACTMAPDTAGEAGDAVYRLEADSCSGVHVVEATAVAVAPDALVTVAHAFDDVRSVRVLTADVDPVEIPVEVVVLDAERDVAVLRPADEVDAVLETATAEAGTVARIITAAQVGELRTKRAVIDEVTRVRVDGTGERLALALAADIAPGDSGAPVVDPEGRLVGMVFAAVGDDGTGGWAVAMEELQPLVADADAVIAPVITTGCD